MKFILSIELMNDLFKKKRKSLKKFLFIRKRRFFDQLIKY
ncbi:hypothetical protein RIEPE_0365 [Candidatus Riesia pediculicola USDA]|uniref:Uncharacterized protein n=1 Tax=Riesia pediculicola (strain USDA) TaxID=515618 RepID=D4G8F3_RIEPU|nr:hypothetical protein RIEPE_0365 [Candidatus Riesia pediculicola USDA]